MFPKPSYSASLHSRRVTRRPPQDEGQKDIATEEGKRRIAKARNTCLELPHAAQEEGPRKCGASCAAQNRSRRRLRAYEPECAPHSLHTRDTSEPRPISWSVAFYFVLAVAISFYMVALTRHVRLCPSGPGVSNPTLQERALVAGPQVVPATELGKDLDAWVSQVSYMVRFLHSSHVADLLPPTYSKELEDLEHNMNTTLYSEHERVVDRMYPSVMLYFIFSSDQEGIRIDASFNEYKLDRYHDLRTLLSVYTQDTINNFRLTLRTANPSVSKPFLSSHERAALLKAEEWSSTISFLSTKFNETLTHFFLVATGPLASTANCIIVLANHLSNVTTLASQPQPCSRMRALLGLPPALVTPSAVNWTDVLEVVATTARTTTHLLSSCNAAIATLTKLQGVLAAGPWTNTHVVTAEQWAAQEKEMCAWMLKVRDIIVDLGVSDWRDFDWNYYWYFGVRCSGTNDGTKVSDASRKFSRIERVE